MADANIWAKIGQGIQQGVNPQSAAAQSVSRAFNGAQAAPNLAEMPLPDPHDPNYQAIYDAKYKAYMAQQEAMRAQQAPK